MEVYVLVRHDTNVDGGEFTTEVIGVYETIDKANAQLREEMKNAIVDFDKNYDYEMDTYVEGDMSWSIWESGYYASNRIDLIIECKTVE